MPTNTNRNWIWFFVVLAILGTVAVAGNWLFNRSQLLTTDQLEEARTRWDKSGPANYDLVIKKRLQRGDSTDYDEIRAAVRAGKVTSATLNNQPLETRLWTDYEMPAWFDFLERFIEIDKKPGAPRAFMKAHFDPADGHITYFLRSVSSVRERVELKIDLTKP